MAYDKVMATPPSLPDRQAVRLRVNQYLEAFFREQLAQAASIGPAYYELWGVTHTLTMAGGKRLRPYLCLLAYHAYGGTDDRTLVAVGAALELLHVGLLIHDDIIDHDTMRYGIDNVSGYYQKYYRREHNLAANAARHYSDSLAMLAGDLLLTSAHTILLDSGLAPAQIMVVQRHLQRALFSVVAGEQFDTDSVLREKTTVDSLRIAELKTATYSMVAPLLCGAELAGASVAERTKLSLFAANLGIAYQLCDDLLGSFGDPSITGKTNQGDLEEGKVTYLLQATLRRCTVSQRTGILKAIGKPLTAHQAEKIRTVMRRCGAVAETEALIDDYHQKALIGLASTHLPATTKQAFRALVVSLLQRQR
ncbi:MAG: crtE [Candidatus Saccharibacteria bacterium]|nr:crtE [Candidatus Saccharibacteria bacterium]